MKASYSTAMKVISATLVLLLGTAAFTSCSTRSVITSNQEVETMNQSPQWRNGRYHNTLKQQEPGIWSVLLKMLRNDAGYTVPAGPVPTLTREADDFVNRPKNGLRVTWLGHSSVLVEIDGYRVLTDPVWSERVSPMSFIGPKRFFEPPLPIDELPVLDAVVISHDHFDHLDRPTIIALKDRVPLFAVPLGVGAYLEQWGVDPQRIVENDWWDEVRIGQLTMTATPARHFSGRSLVMSDQNKTLWSGWAIAGPHHRVYFSGDTAMFPGFREIGNRLGPFDLTMIEAGAYDAMWPDVHIGPEQAIEAHHMVRGTVMMPIHWGTFNLAMHNWTEPVERVLAASDKTGARLVVPKPGESFELAELPELTRWWPDLPWQTADEAPVVSTGPGSGNPFGSGAVTEQALANSVPVE